MQGEQSQVPHQQVHVTVTIKKSVFVAVLLALFFGPLGMLYSTITGGIVMFFVHLVVGLMTIGFGVFITWPIGVIWAAIAAKNANEAITATTLASAGTTNGVQSAVAAAESSAVISEPSVIDTPAEASPDQYRECPFCAERIRTEAKICRFCRSEVLPQGADPHAASAAPMASPILQAVTVISRTVTEETPPLAGPASEIEHVATPVPAVAAKAEPQHRRWLIPVALVVVGVFVLGGYQYNKARQASSAATAVNASASSASPTVPKSLNPVWFGRWMGADGKSEITISAAKLSAQQFQSRNYELNWSNATDTAEGTFNYTGRSTSLAELSQRYENAFAQFQRDPIDYKVSDPVLSRNALSQVMPGNYKIVSGYEGGDCGYHEWLVSGDTLLEVGECKYGFNVLLYRRANSTTTSRQPASANQIPASAQPLDRPAGVALVFDPPSNVRQYPNGPILCAIRSQQMINVGERQAGWYTTDACGSPGVISQNQVRF
jgi:hypothetical protein